jgi:hypothetical protein
MSPETEGVRRRCAAESSANGGVFMLWKQEPGTAGRRFPACLDGPPVLCASVRHRLRSTAQQHRPNVIRFREPLRREGASGQPRACPNPSRSERSAFGRHEAYWLHRAAHESGGRAPPGPSANGGIYTFVVGARNSRAPCSNLPMYSMFLAVKFRGVAALMS